MRLPITLLGAVFALAAAGILCASGAEGPATSPNPTSRPAPAFRVLAFYNLHVERDHISFAKYALNYFGRLAAKNNFIFDSTQDWSQLNSENLKHYQVVVWLNDSPSEPAQREAFER
jgi:hypothetical protein